MEFHEYSTFIINTNHRSSLMLIPQSLSYAKIATIPVEYGLMSSWLPPTIYAIMGSTKGMEQHRFFLDYTHRTVDIERCVRALQHSYRVRRARDFLFALSCAYSHASVIRGDGTSMRDVRDSFVYTAYLLMTIRDLH